MENTKKVNYGKIIEEPNKVKDTDYSQVLITGT